CINGVDTVDAVLDEDTFTPADYLTAQPDVTRVIADGVVVINKGIQELDSGTFLQRMAARVVNIIETLAAVLDFKVVPVVTPDKGPGATVTQLEVVGAFEDLGEKIPFLVVEATVIRRPSCSFTALIPAVNLCQGVYKALVRIGRGHARADRHLRVELP